MNLKWFPYVLLPFLAVTHGFDRALKSIINPGCKGCNSPDINLLYVACTGDHDVVHNIWDFTNGKPTILFMITNLNTTLDFTWDNDTAVAINLSNEPKYSFGIVLNKIWEFDDVNDTATFNPKDPNNIPFDTKTMEWKRTDILMSEDRAIIKVIANFYGDVKRKGDVTVQLSSYPFTDYATDLPHLIHTANSSLIDVALKDMETSSHFNHSRFALELILISTEKSNNLIEMKIRKGIDDEHTPGVFEIIELITPESSSAGDGAFVQYRPVSYISSHRDVANSTKVETGQLSKTTLPTHTVANQYFKSLTDIHLLTEKIIVSMGGKGDGFYKKSNYSIWSFTSGYGTPPAEGLSLLIILILSIGLGVPMVLIVIGGIYICVKRRTRARNAHNILVEE